MIAKFAPPRYQISHLALDDHFLAYGATNNPGRLANPTDVVVRDLRTGHEHVVGHTQWPKTGFTDWVELAGGWVFWTDMSRVPDDGNPDAAWTLKGRPLNAPATVATTTLARSHRDDAPAPRPHGTNGRLLWMEQGDNAIQKNSIKGFDPYTRKTTTYAAHLDFLSEVTGTKHMIVWDRQTGPRPDQPPTRSDLWGMPYTGGKPHQLTHNGQARSPQTTTGSDIVGWEAHGPADDATAYAYGTATPTTIKNITTGTIGTGQYPVVGTIQPGSGYVALYHVDSPEPMIHPFNAKPRYALSLGKKTVSPQCRTAVNYSLIAYCLSGPTDRRGGERDIIKIVRTN